MSSTELRVNAVVPESIVDGPGFRYVVFVQGCPHNCKGCHNPQTHDFDGGYLIDEREMLAEFAENPLLEGITFSGGEPFCQPEACARIAKKVHQMGRDVVVYTGFTLEELRSMEDAGVTALLDNTDLLVDGPFVLAERDLTLTFRGSRNQRLIDLRAERKNLKTAG